MKTHQYQLENILSTGRNFVDTFPQLGEVLEDTLSDIEAEWNSLESHLGIQSKQIQEALAVVETSLGSSTLQVGWHEAPTLDASFYVVKCVSDAVQYSL